jgi:hypothetical protein
VSIYKQISKGVYAPEPMQQIGNAKKRAREIRQDKKKKGKWAIRLSI